MLAWMGGARSKLKAKRKKGDVHKTTGGGIAANHRTLAPHQEKAAQMLQQSDLPAAEGVGPSADEAVDESPEASQCDPNEDPFPVEQLHSPEQEPNAKWQPYKKPKDVKSLDLDTILIPRTKVHKAAPQTGR